MPCNAQKRGISGPTAHRLQMTTANPVSLWNGSTICFVTWALAIATALLQHQFAVHCRITGRCSSAAAFVALAADRRTIVSGGCVLLHTARRLCTPEQWENVKRLKSMPFIGTGPLPNAVSLRDSIVRPWLGSWTHILRLSGEMQDGGGPQ